jgi:uncharacterized protein YydD (DUF2326 family)
MIVSIRCDHAGFKPVDFKEGFNVVLAERTKESTKKGSRNGLGKTLLVEIIHFCLGSRSASSRLAREPLLDWTFTLEIVLRGRRYLVRRNTAKPGRVVIEGDCSFWPIRPRLDAKTGSPSMSIGEWNTVLGWLTFDIPVNMEDAKYTPTFRSLISYFLRRGRDAFSSPFEHHPKQREWDRQVNNAFLLGLAWEDAQQWQILKDQKNALAGLRAAAQSGLMSNLIGSIGDLEATKIRLEGETSLQAEQLGTFRVHPQYREIEERANQLTVEIHELADQNMADRMLVRSYETSFQQEEPASQESVVKLYEEAGVALPHAVVRRLHEVQEFHQQVAANRRRFLQDEVGRLEQSIQRREHEIRAKPDARANLLAILQSHGALEEYNGLQQRHLEAVSRLDDVRVRIENLRRFEQGAGALRIDLERLQLRARADYEDRLPIRERALSLFNANSEALYEAPGKLITDIGPAGFRFQVEIERSGSQGIDQMKVFCYDLMLAQLWASRGVRPGLLMHDSTIFDGVDERQIGLALELAASAAGRRGFQYICCLNSDVVPWEFSSGFDLRQYVALELTDVREDGSLLGMRF